MKKFLALFLALTLVLALAGCVAGGVAADADDAAASLAPEQAAQEAIESTQDKMNLSDIIRVPFGYLLDWLDRFANNYGVSLILFSLIVKLVLLPMSIKSKKSMLKMSRLAPMAKALEAKYGDDKQKYQLALQQMYKDEGVSMGGGCLWSFIPLLIMLPLYYVILANFWRSSRRCPFLRLPSSARSTSRLWASIWLRSRPSSSGRGRTRPGRRSVCS